MLNQIILVGRLVSNPEVNEDKASIITLAVPRSYKNEEGAYETDFIDVNLYNISATQTSEYCRKGDLIGIKGRTETRISETENGNKKKQMIIIADKVTFLSSHRGDENE